MVWWLWFGSPNQADVGYGLAMVCFKPFDVLAHLLEEDEGCQTPK